MIIYRITNTINNKKYIGQTIGSLSKRWKEHCSTRPSCRLLHSAIKKYGKENFLVEEIDSCASIEELNLLEQKYIKLENSLCPNGYNLDNGGCGKGKHSELTKQKIREAHLGKPKKPLSEIHKEKLRISNKGKCHSNESKRKISKSKDRFKKSIIDQFGNVYPSIYECSKTLNIFTSAILKVLKGINKQTHGYTFKYYSGE